MMIVLGLWAVVSTLFSCACVWASLRLGDFVVDLEDNIETAITTIDDCHQEMVTLSKVEVMMDEPIVRQAINSLVRSRDALLFVSNLISTFSLRKGK